MTLRSRLRRVRREARQGEQRDRQHDLALAPPGLEELPDRRVVAVGVARPRVVVVHREPGREAVARVGESGQGNHDPEENPGADQGDGQREPGRRSTPGTVDQLHHPPRR